MNTTTRIVALAVVTLVALAGTSLAYPSFRSRIPNGFKVPNPCPGGGIWDGVGHQSPAGANARNPFGLDFKAAGFAWTPELCSKDSDGDGLTNGQELGDPDCVWTPGAAPSRTTGLSHPGICPLDSADCTNAWTVCPDQGQQPKQPLNCAALINDSSVYVKNITLKSTPIPARETTYICQAFELNDTATPVHLVGSHHIVDNKAILHHMVLFACTVKPDQALFDTPRDRCFMEGPECAEILTLWSIGLDTLCYTSQAGVRIGGAGFRYAVLQLHWNNPTNLAGQTDGSGFSLYFARNLRPYDMGILYYGDLNLVLPPRQPSITVHHSCPSTCTNYYHASTRYISGVAIHMHTFGIRGRISLWRNGALVKDLFPHQGYDYNAPKVVFFDPPIEYRPGDEVRTECHYSTLKTNNTTFWGYATSDEMCFAFLFYYPNNITLSSEAKLDNCIALSGINLCWLQSRITPQVERGCDIAAMRSGDMPTRVLAEMSANNCFARTGCDPMCRNYLNDTLWPSNACYDPKRSRQMAEVMAGSAITSYPVNQTIATTLYGQRFCEQEINMLAELDRQKAEAPSQAGTTTASPSTTTKQCTLKPISPLTSEHLLTVIIVCSCLGFVILMAIVIGLLCRSHLCITTAPYQKIN